MWGICVSYVNAAETVLEVKYAWSQRMRVPCECWNAFVRACTLQAQPGNASIQDGVTLCHAPIEELLAGVSIKHVVSIVCCHRVDDGIEKMRIAATPDEFEEVHPE